MGTAVFTVSFSASSPVMDFASPAWPSSITMINTLSDLFALSLQIFRFHRTNLLWNTRISRNREFAIDTTRYTIRFDVPLPYQFHSIPLHSLDWCLSFSEGLGKEHLEQQLHEKARQLQKDAIYVLLLKMRVWNTRMKRHRLNVRWKKG